MSLRPAAIVALLVVPLFAGCAGLGVDFLGGGCTQEHTIGPGGRILREDAWNRDNVIEVNRPGATVRIEAEGGPEGRPTSTIQAESGDSASLTIPDGTWTVRYFLDGSRCATMSGVRIDTVPPQIDNLELVADAPGGAYDIGAGARVSGHVALDVIDQADGEVLGHSLPVHVEGLESGLQAYLITARDAAGNYANATVQVRVGTATQLPKGQYDFGVVARYTNRVRLWDLSRPEAYLSIAAARTEAGDTYLGSGFGVTPDDPEVKKVVAQVVTPGMNTMQAAIALYKWFADNLEYDELRLETQTLLTPRQVLLDTEDKDGRDCPGAAASSPECDGIVADGAGNGVRGGICRDLAATFVSLLRGAGIPARLVSGYVGGEVNGFHAWVEFYAGAVSGQSPWVPVDVSGIDDEYKVDGLLQSFGIQRPDYLPLRQVPPGAEVGGWSTALSVHYTWPQERGAQPDVRLLKDLQVASAFTVNKVLCVNTSTLARLVAESRDACRPPAYGQVFDPFLVQTERTIDYGIDVASAPAGTLVRAEVAYPFERDVLPDTVVHTFYGPSFTLDGAAGKAKAEWYPSGR